jgi:hypothetical protein
MFPPILRTCVGGNMKSKFEQFIRERKYLSNATPATLEWYGVDVVDSGVIQK